jgi:hypothetical protein
VLLTSGWKGSRFAVTASDFIAGAGSLVAASDGFASELAAGAGLFDDDAFAFRAALFAGALCAPAADESVNESASTAHTVADDFASFIVFALRQPY